MSVTPSTDICSICGAQAHSDFTCFYNLSVNEFQVIDLSPLPENATPSNYVEREYLRVRTSFNQNLSAGSRFKVKSIKLIVNKALERRYLTKKQAMAIECGGYSNLNEVYMWHGSPFQNYDAIMRDGLKIGGVDSGIPVVHGTSYGYGIYSTLAPNTPIGYANNSKWLLHSLALKGNPSTAKIDNPGLLNNGKTHSFSPNNDWIIFFTKDQVLPRFLVEYEAY